MLVLKKKDIYFTIELSLMVISFVKLYAHEQLYPLKKSCPSLIIFCYISKLVRALWLVNLVGRTLPYGWLKFRILFVAKLLRDLSPNFSNKFS